MGVNQPVLDIAYVSNDMAGNTELQQMLGAFANALVPATPRIALEEWKPSSCEHALIVIDGYSLGREALGLCRRLRLVGINKPIILTWMRDTDLDRAVCQEFGASAVISRPFDLNKIASSIRTATTGWAAVDQSYGTGARAGVRRQATRPAAATNRAHARSKVEPMPVA